MNRPIAQEHLSGCGIACVAYVLNISYRTALKRTDNPEQAASKGYSCSELVSVLNLFKDDKFSYCYLSNKRNFLLKKHETIVFIKRSKRYPIGHYLVKTKRGWMDPWFNYPNINPPKAKFVKKLPGVPIYAIYKKSTDGSE